MPGIFKQMTVQAGLNYEVALSTRNAATLRGHFLNTANANWDLRSNITSQRWDKVVLQEQSDEALPAMTVGGVSLGSNYASFEAYANLVENHVHLGNALSYRERDVVTGSTNGTLRTIPANSNANLLSQVYLQQTWARPNLINAPGATTINPATGNASYSGAPATSFYADLETMTGDLGAAFARAASFAAADGSGGFAGVVPVGDAFLRAVNSGVATRDLYAADAVSDGLIDLWFNDGTHASVHGAYLSALTLFGSITGIDPQSLGASEVAAFDLGILPADVLRLQRVAALELGFAAAVPEPATQAMLALGLLSLLGCTRRRRTL